LALGTLKGNSFVDGKRKFFRSFEKVISDSFHYRLKIASPFITWTKERVLKCGNDLPLSLSFSCLSPKGYQPCRKCNKCAERMKVFKRGI